MEREEQSTSIYNLHETIVDYISQWISHLLIVNDTHVTKLMYEYVPAGRRHIGRPRKRK